MPDKPIDQRPYRTFLSHAHKDHRAVAKLYQWLSQVADIRTWYDAERMGGGADIGSALAEQIGECRSLTLVVSKTSVVKQWVKNEWNLAEKHRGDHPAFAIVPVRLDATPPPDFSAARSWVDVPRGKLSLKAVAQYLRGLYPDDGYDAETARDVYVSASWQDHPVLDAVATRVCRELVASRFRLIGDARDQKHYSAERIRGLVATCGGLVAVLPARPNGTTSKYILQEVRTARELGLPTLVVADPAVRLPPPAGSVPPESELPADAFAGAVRVGPDDVAAKRPEGKWAELLAHAVRDFAFDWRQPARQHLFLATAFKKTANAARNELIREVIQRVTSMRCVLGTNIRGDGAQKAIFETIRTAHAVVADIAEPDGDGFKDNINTLVEAGAGRGGGRPVLLLAAGPKRSPPFLFRDIEVQDYQSEVELLGKIHRLVHPYRRRVIAPDLTALPG